MTLWEHLAELRSRAIRMAAAVGIISAITFAFTIREITVAGVKLYYLWPDVFHNIPSLVVDQAKGDLLPDFVEIIVTAPAQAIFAEFAISLFLGVLVGMPIILYETVKFVSPGMKPREKTLMKAIVGPATGLFAAGVIFAYVMVLPFTYNFLYLYAIAFEALTFLTIADFISFSMLFMLAMGLAFQLPLIMIGLTYVGVVQPKFWKDNFRYAFVAIAIFAAIITPDGSGVTMWFIAVPMAALYGAGYLFSKKYRPAETTL